LTFESERYGNKQKKAHANNEAACRCDIVIERFDPIRNKGNDLLKYLTENFYKKTKTSILDYRKFRCLMQVNKYLKELLT